MKRKTINRAPYTGAPMGFVADTTPPAPVAYAYVWMQNNTGGVVLAPHDDTASLREYDWPTHAVNSKNYAGIRLRMSDKTYTGATGEPSTGKFIDATTSDLNVVKLCTANDAPSNDSKITVIASNGQFNIVGAGSATITYRYKHPTDDSIIITAILYVTAS